MNKNPCVNYMQVSVYGRCYKLQLYYNLWPQMYYFAFKNKILLSAVSNYIFCLLKLCVY